MLKKFWYLFLVLLIEGSSLMAIELLGAKLPAPFYGSSLIIITIGFVIRGLIIRSRHTDIINVTSPAGSNHKRLLMSKS